MNEVKQEVIDTANHLIELLHGVTDESFLFFILDRVRDGLYIDQDTYNTLIQYS